MAGMTRREVAFLAIGSGFSSLVGSFIVAYECARNVSDWHGFSEMFEVMGINESAFLIPAVILLAGLALLVSRKPSDPLSK
jgi:hypothetical protein